MEHLFSSTKATTLSGIQIHPGQHRFQLLNFLSSGNLVLIDNVTSTSESYLWKSYDYPINTLLPGMMIGKDMSNGLNQFLTSCKDSDIASPGDSTYKFDYKGLPQIYIFVKVEAKRLILPLSCCATSTVTLFIYLFFKYNLSYNFKMVLFNFQPYKCSPLLIIYFHYQPIINPTHYLFIYFYYHPIINLYN